MAGGSNVDEDLEVHLKRLYDSALTSGYLQGLNRALEVVLTDYNPADKDVVFAAAARIQEQINAEQDDD